MATARRIAEVKLIEGADKICAYRVDGWWVVDAIDKYKLDDLVVYAEPDSWVPHTIAPFLTKPGQFPKVYNEVEGQRLRTIKLRGQISQGLLLPLDVAMEKFVNSDEDDSEDS
jgi:RNA ligase (TIGR02306 family)